MRPSDFLNDEAGVFFDARPFGFSELSGAEALYTPNAVVVGVLGRSEGGPNPRILGLDPSSGQVRWQLELADTETSPTCFSLASKPAIACLASQQLTAVDTSTNDVAGPVPSAASAVLDGASNNIYSVSYTYSNADTGSDNSALAAVTVQQGSLSNPVGGWQRTYAVDSARGYDGRLAATEVGGRLGLDLEGIQLLVDSDSGELLEQRDDPQQSASRPFGFGDAQWQDVDPDPTSVTSGSTRITIDDALTEVSATALERNELAWSRPLPSLQMLDDEDGEGVGRSSIGIAGSSVVFSSRLVVEGWTGFGAGTSDDLDREERYRTPCGREPEVIAQSGTNRENSVEVGVRFVATCPGGQWVDGPTVRIVLSGESGETLGRAVYDFSRAPLWLPDARSDSGSDAPGVGVTLELPPGSVYALADELESQISTIVVECEQSAGSNGPDNSPSEVAGGSPSYLPYAPETGGQGANADALAALKRLAASDKPFVDENLEGKWVPQLSSKKDGTTDALDDFTYDYADILAEHVRLRLRYPDVRLLFSSNWKSFLEPGYWVTVEAVPSPTSRRPNAFCDDERFPYSHCHAKRILRDGPSDGATKRR